MWTTGEQLQRRRQPVGRAGRRAEHGTATRLGVAAATGLSLALAFSLGATAVADATPPAGSGRGDAGAVAPAVVYGGAPSGARPEDGGAATSAAFALATGVRAELVALWDASVVANEERVACIGGTRGKDGVIRITRVYALPVVSADSANAGAGPSLATCRPPAWFGTVHTHIITDAVGAPYTQFSSPDRDVIARWQRAWRADGVFCLLYSEADAHCELGGGQAAANVTYALDGEGVAYSTAAATPRR